MRAVVLYRALEARMLIMRVLFRVRHHRRRRAASGHRCKIISRVRGAEATSSTHRSLNIEARVAPAAEPLYFIAATPLAGLRPSCRLIVEHDGSAAGEAARQKIND